MAAVVHRSRSGTPRHRLERFRFILEWFAKYLHEGQESQREARQGQATAGAVPTQG